MSVVNPLVPQGMPPPSFPPPPVTPSSPPPQMGPFISPQNTNDGKEGFQRGWCPPPPLNASSGEEWQAVDEGGEREGPTSKQTTANTNKDGCLSAFL